MNPTPHSGESVESGPLSTSHNNTPPILKDYSATPQYDLATVVHLVGVRAIILWNWEQQLGIPQRVQPGDAPGATARTYSERDLLACIWLRDQLVQGRTAVEAAAVLMQAQPAAEDDDATATTGGHGDAGSSMARLPVNSRPLGQATTWGRPFDRPPVETTGSARVSGTSYSGGMSGPLRAAPPSGPLRAPGNTAALNPTLYPGIVPPAVGAGPSRQSVNSLPLSASGYQLPTPPGPYRPSAPSGPLSTPSNAPWNSQSMPVPVVLPGSSSGPLRARPSGTLPFGGQRLSGSSGQWAQAPAAMGRELRSLVQPMLRAFVTFDTFMANQLIDEALSARSVEAMCVGLLIPALNRVSDLWGRNELSIPEERFATNFVRARLFSIFARTAEQPDAPLAVMACGPREVSDLNALVLATFWRRAGIRVVFLGQDVDGPALVHDVRMRRPRLVCVAIASSQRLRALSRIAKSVSQIETPTPLFTYSGAPFARNPELRHKISGIYLGDDPATATWHAMRLLSAEMRGTPPAAPTGGMGQVG